MYMDYINISKQDENGRKITVLKTGVNSWQLVYADEIRS